MQRATGTGFIGFGLVLIVVGAICKFAITADANGFDIETAGLIAIWAGVVSLLIGILLVVMGGRRRSTVRENVVQTPSGTERVQERDDFNTAL
jgi:hypothetical protein